MDCIIYDLLGDVLIAFYAVGIDKTVSVVKMENQKCTICAVDMGEVVAPKNLAHSQDKLRDHPLCDKCRKKFSNMLKLRQSFLDADIYWVECEK